MPGLAIGAAGSLFGGLAGLFGGGKQQKVQTNGTITNNQTGTFGQNNTQTVTPNLNPLQAALMKQFTQGASQLFNQSTNLNPYAASGLESINQQQNANSKAIAANLASRGLGFSPAANTAMTQNILAGGQQKAQFMNNIPLLQRQLQEQSLGDLENAFKTMPIGQTSTGSSTGNVTQSGTQNQQGTNLVSGNPMAGLFSGLGAGLSASMPLLYNSFGGNNNSNLLPGFTGMPSNPVDNGGDLSNWLASNQGSQ